MFFCHVLSLATHDKRTLTTSFVRYYLTFRSVNILWEQRLSMYKT